MRKKYIENVYMREVEDKVFYCEENSNFGGYIGIKYINKIQKPLTSVCNGKKYVGLDKGYSLLEYVPHARNYNCRVFFNDKNQPLLFYFDINNGTGKDENGVWYDDLYLDVVFASPLISDEEHYILLDDENEFKNAKDEGIIDEVLFKKGYAVAKSLIKELKEDENDIVKRCENDIIRIKRKLDLK